MEASALHAPALRRRTPPAPLLRLRSDEQLVALFRAGSEDAFAAMHDRYRQRLFAYVRQMLSAASRADAEDVLQDVFVRAYGALRADEREVNLRAWLYRVAHNRCIDHLRRPTPPAGEVFDMSRTPPLQDPLEAAQRRDDLRRLVDDVGRLPDQQRSALLMREIDGLAYADIADALDVTLPAVKSLLVRARVGLVEAAEARDTDCAEIRADLLAAYDRGVKASGRARRHMRECDACREYRGALRGMRRSFAALSPVAGLGPLAIAAKALGLGGAGGGAAAGGGALATGGGAIATGATACKVAAVVCTAVVATGGAVEVKQLADPVRPHHARAATTAPAASAPAAAPAAPATAVSALVAVPVSDATIRHRTGAPATAGAGRAARDRDRDAGDHAKAGGGTAVASPVEDPAAPAGGGTTATGTASAPDDGSGGATAPDGSVIAPAKPPGGTTTGTTGSGAGGSATGGSGGSGTAAPPVTQPAGSPSGGAAEAPAGDPPAPGTATPPATSGPPPEH